MESIFSNYLNNFEVFKNININEVVYIPKPRNATVAED